MRAAKNQAFVSDFDAIIMRHYYTVYDRDISKVEMKLRSIPDMDWVRTFESTKLRQKIHNKVNAPSWAKVRSPQLEFGENKETQEKRNDFAVCSTDELIRFDDLLYAFQNEKKHLIQPKVLQAIIEEASSALGTTAEELPELIAQRKMQELMSDL